MKFKQLCHDIGLEQNHHRVEKSRVLVDWCHENISEDVQFTGTEGEIYEKYYQLAFHYLDTFMPIASKGILIDENLIDNLSPLHYAARYGYHKYLSNQNKRDLVRVIDSKDRLGLTPLHYACIFGHVETVKTLLLLGASMDSTNHEGQTPLYSCLVMPNVYEASLLKNKIAIALHFLDEMNTSSSGKVDKEGNTVMHQVVLHTVMPVLQKLIGKDKQLAYVANHFMRYPIHVAILNHQTANVAALLRLDGMDELVDEKGRSALHYAALYGSAEILALCCKHCRNINCQDKEGKTPLMHAAISGQLDLIQQLLKVHADPSLTSSRGMTVLDYAREHQHQKVIEYLENLDVG